jgi:hypothetical protein
MLSVMTASDDNEILTTDEMLTADDITGLNRQAVARTAAFTRLAGTALVVAGAIATAAWLYLVVRQQQIVDDGEMFSPSLAVLSEDVSFAQRVDLLASQVTLGIWAVVAVGVGLGLRLVADYSVARTGGSLTGYEVGDRV